MKKYVCIAFRNVPVSLSFGNGLKEFEVAVGTNNGVEEEKGEPEDDDDDDNEEEEENDDEESLASIKGGFDFNLKLSILVTRVCLSPVTTISMCAWSYVVIWVWVWILVCEYKGT